MLSLLVQTEHQPIITCRNYHESCVLNHSLSCFLDAANVNLSACKHFYFATTTIHTRILVALTAGLTLWPPTWFEMPLILLHNFIHGLGQKYLDVLLMSLTLISIYRLIFGKNRHILSIYRAGDFIQLPNFTKSLHFLKIFHCTALFYTTYKHQYFVFVTYCAKDYLW